MRWFVVLLGIGIAAPAVAACGEADTAIDSGEADEDCDNDGWSKGQGDCDDDNASANPGRAEDCAVAGDEDCDGLVDEGCVAPILGGSLQGGSACGPPAGVGVAGVVAAALLARRRRR